MKNNAFFLMSSFLMSDIFVTSCSHRKHTKFYIGMTESFTQERVSGESKFHDVPDNPDLSDVALNFSQHVLTGLWFDFLRCSVLCST